MKKTPEQLLLEIREAYRKCWLYLDNRSELNLLIEQIDEVCAANTIAIEPVWHCNKCGGQLQLSVPIQCCGGSPIDISTYPAWKWLKPLPVWIRERAVRNCLEAQNDLFGLRANDICLTFNWDETTEGNYFWYEVNYGNYAEAEKILKEQE